MNLYLLIVAVFSGMTFIVSIVGLAVTDASKTTKPATLHGGTINGMPSDNLGASAGWSGEMIVEITK